MELSYGIHALDIINGCFAIGRAMLGIRDIEQLREAGMAVGVSRWPRLYGAVWAGFSVCFFGYLGYFLAMFGFITLATIEGMYFYELNRVKTK